MYHFHVRISPGKTTARNLDLALAERPEGKTIFTWFYDEVRSAILDGRLLPGARLPSTRDIAKQYRISRGIVVAAMEQLQAEGYLAGKTGSGTYVKAVIPDDLLGLNRRKPKLPRLPALDQVPEWVRIGVSGWRLKPFLPHLTANDQFPQKLWAQVASRRLRRLTPEILLGADTLGYRPLREAIAGYLGGSRGVKCTADQIVVVSGVQQGLDLTVRQLLRPGDGVWMEEPGYLGAREVFQMAGARLTGVPVDEEGLDVEAGDRLGTKPRLIYVTPAHQFPLGVTMTLERRFALLDWARKADALIFEDDYDSEFRYAGRPVPALQGLNGDASVIYAGSFNKVLFHSLRLGYVVVPERMVDAFASLRWFIDRFPPGIEQAVLCDFLTEGHFGRHIRRMRELYANRLGALVDAAEKKLGDLLTIRDTHAGLQTVGWLGDGLQADAVARAASDLGVVTVPLGKYSLTNESIPALQLGFAGFDEQQIRLGVDQLARAVEVVGRIRND